MYVILKSNFEKIVKINFKRNANVLLPGLKEYLMGFTKKQCREQKKNHETQKLNYKKKAKHPRKQEQGIPTEALKEEVSYNS